MADWEEVCVCGIKNKGFVGVFHLDYKSIIPAVVQS